jgi:hypothetical protein
MRKLTRRIPATAIDPTSIRRHQTPTIVRTLDMPYLLDFDRLTTGARPVPRAPRR